MGDVSRLKNKEWRIEHLYKIVDKQGQLITFKRNPVQSFYNQNKHKRNIILKSRQLGITTEAIIDLFDSVIFNNNLNCVIIAHDQESLQRMFHKAAMAWRYFPQELKSFLRLQVIKNNQSEIQLNNGSRLAITLSSRSDTVHRLHISE